MIRREALEEFLAQPKDDFRWMKELTHADLDAELAQLQPPPKFSTTRPMDLHQKIGFLLWLSYSGFYLQYEMGTGKTRIAIEVYYYRFVLGECDRMLVLVPADTNVLGWRDEILKWHPDIKCLPLVSMDTEEKVEALMNFDKGIAICTYNAFNWMVSDLVPSKKKRGKSELQHNLKKLRMIGKHLDALVCDEATKISSRDSLIFVALRNLAKEIPFRLMLAGRPFGKDPTDLWSQYFIVDRGNTLGETLGMFREAFYDAKNKFDDKPWMKKWNRRLAFANTYKLKPGIEGLFNRFLQNRSLYYASDECADLPPIRTITRTCEMPIEQRRYWNAMVEKAKHKAMNREGAEGVDNIFLRMRQIVSGFVGLREEDTGDRIELKFPSNPKLDMMLDDIIAMPEGKQAVIFCEFEYTGRMIHEALEKLKIPHGWVYGKTKTADFDRIKKTAETTPGYHILAGWKKMGIGVDAPFANYVFLYETPTSPDDRDQAIHRARRRSSREHGIDRVFVTDYIMTGSKDAEILEAIEKGDDLHMRLIRAPRLLFDEVLPVQSTPERKRARRARP